MDDESPCLFCGLPCDWAEITAATLQELAATPWRAISFTYPEHEDCWCCDKCYFARKHDSLSPDEAARIDLAWEEAFGSDAHAEDPFQAELLRIAAERPHEYFSSGSGAITMEDDGTGHIRVSSERAPDSSA